MATATDLISNTGNVNLGLGENGDIPVSSTNDQSVINDAAKNMELLNHDNNVNIFKQKVVDRDKLYTLLDNGIIPSGDIEDKDRPYYDKAEKDVMDAFHKIKGINDLDAIEEFNKKAANLKDVVTHAQGRHLGLSALRTEQSQQTLKAKQDAYGNHIKTQEDKPFNSMIDPYQQALDFDKDHYKSFLTGALSGTNPLTATTDKTTTTNKGGVLSTTNTESTTNPSKTKGPDIVGSIVYKDGLPYSRTSQYYDFGKIRQQAVGDYLNPKGEGLEQQNMLRGYLESSDDSVVQPILSHIITRLGDYNNDRGLQKGDPGYIDVDNVKKQWGYDPITDQFKRNTQTGKIQFGTSTPDLNAYWALASVDGSYAPTTDVFMKDEAKALNDKDKTGADWLKARAYANKINYAISSAKTEAEKQKVVDDEFKRNLIGQESLIKSTSSGKVPLLGIGNYEYSTINASSSLPLFTFNGKQPTLLQPIDGVAIHSTSPTSGDGSKKSPYIYSNKDKITGWKGGYYNQEYLFNNTKDNTLRPLNINDFEKMYNNYSVALKKKGSDVPSIDDFTRGLIDNDILDVKLIGENGATDKNISLSAMQAISNIDSKKGQQNPFNSEDAPTEEIETTQSRSESNSGE